MNTIDLVVVAGGLGAALWVNWYFFHAGRDVSQATMASTGSRGEQEVRIVVKGGYEPSTVRVAAGRPVRLVFDRQEASSCSEEVVFADFGLRRFLPAHQETVLEVTPAAPGTYPFTCGMGLMHGRLVAE